LYRRSLGSIDHALNICVTGYAGIMKIRFIEPQSEQFGFRNLTPSELQTIRLLKI
jgi:hypothetical protein